MHVRLLPAAVYLLLCGCLLASVSVTAQQAQTFTGIIIDDQCAGPGHIAMRMDPSDAECTKLCVISHGAEYVLLDGKTEYRLSDQVTPERLAAERVRVVGTLDPKTKIIQVQSIAAAK
jgi:hypothetical protein